MSRETEIRKCEICGNDFIVYESSTQKYCSKACKEVALSKRSSEYMLARSKAVHKDGYTNKDVNTAKILQLIGTKAGSIKKGCADLDISPTRLYYGKYFSKTEIKHIADYLGVPARELLDNSRISNDEIPKELTVKNEPSKTKCFFEGYDNIRIISKSKPSYKIISISKNQITEFIEGGERTTNVLVITIEA